MVIFGSFWNEQNKTAGMHEVLLFKVVNQSEGGALPPPNGLFFSCARWNAAGVALAGIFFSFFRWVAQAQINLISSWGDR